MRRELASRILMALFFKRSEYGCIDGPCRIKGLTQWEEGQIVRLANILLEGKP